MNPRFAATMELHQQYVESANNDRLFDENNELISHELCNRCLTLLCDNDKLVTNKKCPRCELPLSTYKFSVDGHIIETFHCCSCGDIVP